MPSIRRIFFLQPSLWSGRDGASGPNALHLVVLGTGSEPEHAVNKLLEAMGNVLDITLRLSSVRYSSVQVVQRDCVLIQFYQFFHGVNDVAAVDAEWQEWGRWSQCTTSCGPGLKFRARACSQPAFGGNEQCPGNNTEAEQCETSKCAGSFL